MSINRSLNASIHALKEYLASTGVCPKSRIDDHLARVFDTSEIREQIRCHVFYQEEIFREGKTPLDLSKYKEKVRNAKTEEKVDQILVVASKEHPASLQSLKDLAEFAELRKKDIREWEEYKKGDRQSFTSRVH